MFGNAGKMPSGAGSVRSKAVHCLFISHAGVDSEAALRLARRLEDSDEAKAHGLKVWIDKADLAAGRPWKDALQSALNDSTAFAVYIGSRGVVNWVWDEVSVALDRAHREPRYPLVPVLAQGTSSGDLPSFLSQYQGVGDPELPEEFRKLLRAVLRLDARAEVDLEREPFVGLQAYTSRHVHLFFGREQETEDLIALLRETPFLLVTGDSGSGKSSLVLAGLVPAFRGGRFGRPASGPDETIWHVVDTRPGTDPFGRLADSVRASAEQTGIGPKVASELADLVRTRQPDKVRDAILSGAPKDTHHLSKVLLVVDQFEEFRTSPQAASYATTLLHLARPGDDRIRVVLTMRRDYLYICDSFPDLRERLQAGGPSVRYLLRRMSAGLHAAITKPLVLAGLEESVREDLARAVLNDVGDEPGELALLQMALWRTWSEARGYGPDLVRAYTRIGRVEGALALAAEEVFARLSSEDQQRAETLFVRLVRPGEAGGATRRVAHLDEFDEPARILADKLSQEKQWRLLMIHEDTVEIAHEQLASQWLRYQRWIANIPADPERSILSDPRGDDLRLLQSLIDDAARWQAAPQCRKTDYLAKGVDLELYTQLRERRLSWISKVELLFSEASEEAQRAEHDAKELALEREKARLREVEIAQAEKATAQSRTERAQRHARWTLFAILLLVVTVVFLGLLQQRATARREAFVMTGVASRAINEGQFERAMRSAMRTLPRAFSFPWELGWSDPETRRLEAKLAGAAQASRFLVELDEGSETRSAEFSPDEDGAHVLTASDDGLVRIWDSRTGAQLVALRTHAKGVMFATFSPDGSRVLTASFDGTASLWDVKTEIELLRLQHKKEVFSAHFSSDGKLILTASKDGTTHLWDAETGIEVLVLTGRPFVDAGLSPDGTQIVTASSGDRTARIWDTKTGSEILPALTGHENDVRTAAFSADGSRIITASWDHTARVWDSKSHTTLFELKGHSDAVRSAAFSPDGTRIITASNDGTARIWQGNSAILQLNGHHKAVVSAKFSPDGKRAVTASEDGTTRVWDIQDEPLLVRLNADCSVLAGAFSPDGARVATACSNGKVAIWDAKSGSGLFQLNGHKGPVRSVVFNAVGTSIATAGFDKTARIWDAHGGGEVRSLIHADAVNSAAIAPNGAIATASDDGTVRVWDPSSGAEVLRLKAAQGAKIWSAVFSADGSRILTASSDKTARVWDAKTGAALLQLNGHDEEVVSAVYDKNSTRILTSSWDHTAQVWDASTGRKLPVTLSHKGYLLFGAIFSPDAERIITASADKTARVWDSVTGTELLALKGHTDVVRSVSISSDGTRILTTSTDRTALIWDARWLVTLRRQQLIDAVCKEKLVRAAQVFTFEDNEADSALSAFHNENVCASRDSPEQNHDEN